MSTAAPETRADPGRDGFARMRTIADAVLYEGYLLYPYRASSDKNRMRWQFGVLAPEAWSEATGIEPWWMQSQCLLEVGSGAWVRGRARFLQPETRRLEVRGPDGGFEPAEQLEVDGRIHQSWEEAVVREVDFEIGIAERGAASPLDVPIVFEAATRFEPITDRDGAPVGRFARETRAVSGNVRITCVDLGNGLIRLGLHGANRTPLPEQQAPRDEVLLSSFTGFHLLLCVEGGAFQSLADPPKSSRAAAEACTNVRSWPVLAGSPGDRTLLLASPIILEDHPQVAPESEGDFFDATEMDEMLSLRTATLTEREKSEARATDPRAAAIIDRCESLSPELMDKLHGAIRSLAPVAQATPTEDPDRGGENDDNVHGEGASWSGWNDPTVPGEGSVEIDGVTVEKGCQVKLAPRHRADAQDFLLEGRNARVEGVFEDLEGRTYLGVSVSDGEGAESLDFGHGRFLYFYPDEVLPIRREE